MPLTIRKEEPHRASDKSLVFHRFSGSLLLFLTVVMLLESNQS